MLDEIRYAEHPNVEALYIGPIQNDTNWLTMPFYLILGFVDGAFSPSNITECRINSLRFMYNVSRLAFHAKVNYGVDMIMKYTSQTLKQFYPFSFHCYYATSESIWISRTEMEVTSILEVLKEMAYEMGIFTDETRRMVKILDVERR